MKNIDVKSLLIGILATALLFACADADKTSPSIVSEAKAATGVNDKWDDKQEWLRAEINGLMRVGIVVQERISNGEEFMLGVRSKEGWEPITDNLYRKRIK